MASDRASKTPFAAGTSVARMTGSSNVAALRPGLLNTACVIVQPANRASGGPLDDLTHQIAQGQGVIAVSSPGHPHRCCAANRRGHRSQSVRSAAVFGSVKAGNPAWCDASCPTSTSALPLAANSGQ